MRHVFARVGHARSLEAVVRYPSTSIHCNKLLQQANNQISTQQQLSSTVESLSELERHGIASPRPRLTLAELDAPDVQLSPEARRAILDKRASHRAYMEKAFGRKVSRKELDALYPLQPKPLVVSFVEEPHNLERERVRYQEELRRLDPASASSDAVASTMNALYSNLDDQRDTDKPDNLSAVLLLELKEKPLVTASIGTDVSQSSSGMNLSFSLSNLRGRGEQLNVKMQLETKLQSELNIDYQKPLLFSHNNGHITAGVQRQTQDLASSSQYSEQTSGAHLTYTFQGIPPLPSAWPSLTSLAKRLSSNPASWTNSLSYKCAMRNVVILPSTSSRYIDLSTLSFIHSFINLSSLLMLNRVQLEGGYSLKSSIAHETIVDTRNSRTVPTYVSTYQYQSSCYYSCS